MLSEEEKKQIRQTIDQQVKVLNQKIDEYKELTKPIPPENAIGRVSRMDAINNKSVNEAALRQAEKKLAAMKLALERIEDPYFGVCKSCGNTIPLGRILLVPGSTKCVNCAN